MNKEKKHTKLKNRLRKTGWVFLVLFLFATALRLSFKTALIHNFAKQQISSIVNSSLNGTLSIGSIKGDLWNDFTLNNITLTDPDTVLTVSNIHIRHSLPKLLGLTYESSLLQVDSLRVWVREDSSGTFNVQNLIPSDSTESSFPIDLDLQDIQLQNSGIQLISYTYLPHGSLTITDLYARGRLQLFDDFSGSLNELNLNIHEDSLTNSIDLNASAAVDGEQITLNELIMGTGRSFLDATVKTNLKDSTLNVELQTAPFSFADIKPYIEQPLPDENLQLALHANGSFKSFEVELTADGNGFDDFSLVSTLTFDGKPALKKIGLSGNNFDLGYYTADSLDARISNFQITAGGYVDEQIEQADLTWAFTFDDMRYENYRLQSLFGSGTLSNETITANVELHNGKESLVVNADVNRLFSTDPEWLIKAALSGLNPAQWLKNPKMRGEVSLNALASGVGFSLNEAPWEFAIYKQTRPILSSSSNLKFSEQINLQTEPVELAGYIIPDLSITGKISSESLITDGFVQLFENEIRLQAAIQQLLQETRSYSFKASTQQFNLDQLPNLEVASSSINFDLSGSGSFTDTDSYSLSTLVKMDSSSINGATIDTLRIDALLEDNILKVQEGILNSEVIAGSFSGRRNITDRTDPDNNFDLSMKVRNLQPLASLAGADILRATGTIRGTVREVVDNELLFDGTVQLEDIRYDSLFTASNINGKTKISIRDELGYDISLNIDQPKIASVPLQDIGFQAIGISFNKFISGYFNFDIKSEDSGEIRQSGDYAINLENLRTELTWDLLEFENSVQLLSLEDSFKLTYENGSIMTDTLRLTSENNAYLNFAVPYADTLSQKFWMEANNCDFGVIQETIFDERFVDGVLSGDLTIEHSDTTLAGNGAITIENLAYMGTQTDRFSLDFNVKDKRLNAELSVLMQNEEKVRSRIDVPFVPEPPENLSDSFFNEPVSGTFRINPIALEEISEILETLQITETDGILSFDGSMTGTAGQPDLKGTIKLKQASLSGIPIDSASATFNYDHTKKNLSIQTQANAHGQRAASINAKIPVSMDFRTFEIQPPGPNDSLSVNMVTDNFNISVFNDFLNKKFTRNLRGTLNADINFAGTKTSLPPKGYLRLENGRLSIPIAGITLTDINSEITLMENGHLNLDRFSMKSGSGSFSATGSIELEGITPTNLNLDAKANRFKLANTDDYNLTIDLNSNVSGKPVRPKASGTLTVKNGFVYLQNFGERSVEDVQLEEEEVPSFSPYDSLALDMTFVVEQDFFIRNRRYLDMEVEMNGNLEAQKQTAGDLQLFGTLNAQNGYVRPLGKQFNLEEGRFTFSGPLSNPQIFISTSYIPQTTQKQGNPITLYYIIEGPAEEPEFRFQSEPSMEQQDIICYTLFNKPCYALESWQEVISSGSGGSSPSDLLVGVLLDEVEALATRGLGIDIVQIETTNTGSEAGTTTSIKTGWYLNRKTFFAIINEITGTTPETMFILEYMLKNNLDLILTQGDENQQGIDLRWQFDY